MAIIPRPEVPKDHIDFLNDQIKSKWTGMLSAQSRLTNWLFAVPGAGIAGTLTYAAKVEASPGIVAAFILFALALVTIISYGVVMYYTERATTLAFKRDMTGYLKQGSPTWEEVLENDSDRSKEQAWGTFLGWASGILSFYGLVGLALAVLVGPE